MNKITLNIEFLLILCVNILFDSKNGRWSRIVWTFATFLHKFALACLHLLRVPMFLGVFSSECGLNHG